MKKTNFRKKNIGRRSIAVALCIFLITTSMAVSMAAMIKTSSEPASVSMVSDEATEKVNDNVVESIPASEGPTSLSYSFAFAEPSLGETKMYKTAFTKINMPGCMAIGRGLGAPNIPVKFVKLLLPPGKEVASIDVTGVPVEIDTTSVNLQEKPVVPHQKPVPIGDKPSRELVVDSAIYESSDAFPSEIYKDQGIGYCRGYAILTVALNPMQYLPDEGRLLYYPEMTVDIELEDNGYVDQFYRDNLDDEEWVRKLVYNPEMTGSYKAGGSSTFAYPGGLCDPSDDYDYVIITTTYNGLDHWVTTPSIPYNWTSLMDKHESDDGLSCTLVTMQDIDACSDYWDPDPLFDDTPAHIREFCKDAYQDWGTDYIFIGGDDEWIPAREMDYDYESNVEADIYWNHLDNTFNDDGDNDWGEEGDTGFDLYAEMFIGRITCDEPQDVSNWMKKSFYYADSNSQDYLDNAAFYGCVTGWNCEGDDFIDYSAIQGTDDWLGPIPGDHGPYPSWLGFQYGFETWNALNPGTEYDLSVKWSASSPNPGWQGGTESQAIAGMKNAINDDQVTLISGIAHANEHLSLDVYDTSWESDYHNTMPFFIHDYGCHCGDMDAADDGVLHSMLFYSDTELAFACVYNTGYGWGSFDDTNSSSALQQKLFWDYMFDTTNNSGSTMNWQMGKAMAFSKDSMAPTIDWTYSGAPGSWRGIIESCLLFGDPAQRIKPPVQPEHNIGIQALDVSAHEPADTDIWVNVTLYNNGRHNETNVEVRFLVEGMEENSTNISLFEKGTIMEVGWLYHTPSLGWETLCVNVTMVPGENISIDNLKCREVIYGPDIAVSAIQAPSYLGQGFPEPIKGFIENLGPTDETVTVQFFANDTLEDNTSIYLVSGSSTWVTFMWDATTSGLGTYDVMIHAVPVVDEYYFENQNKSREVTVFEAIGKVLLVDDDEGDSYEWWYENALLASSYVYDIYDRDTEPSPSPALMQGYTAVVWFTGNSVSTTLQSDDQTNLATYLDNGGKLFVSGQDIGYDIRSDPFYEDYLHADYLADTAGWDVVGEAGDVIGDGLAFGISSGDGANNQNYPDGIAPLAPATSCFYYDGTSYKAGIRVTDGVYRIVYFGFGFEAINHMDARTTVISRIISWLAAEHDIAVTNLDVLDYVPYNETTYVKATIINGGINDESNIVVNFTVNGTVEDSTVISSLNAGQSQLVSFAWNPDIGWYVVGIEAEPVPGENITSNNALYKTVHVVPSPDIWVDPTEFDFHLNEGVVVVDTLTIGNEYSAEGDLIFDISISGGGAGEYSQSWHSNYPGEEDIIEAMYFGDADNDGNMELLVGTDDVHVIAYSSGSYYEESVITQTDGQLSSAIIADMDDDGENEVKACDIIVGPGKEWIVEWSGSEWIEQWSHTYGGSGHSQFAQPVGDIDEDGKNETLVGGYASDTVIILSYNPITGNYEQEYEWTEGAGTPSGVCVVDLDGNGDLEFAVSWVYGSANGVYAYDWDGTTLTTLDSYSGTGFDFAFDIYACDYDEDGDTEVLIANWPSPVIGKARGIGANITEDDIPEETGIYHVTSLGWDSGSFVHEASWGSGESSTENPMIWSGDTDGDGHIEVIACASANTVYALNWNGASWDADVVVSGLPSHPYAAVAGDIDGDGIDEIGIGLEGTDAYVYDWIRGWLSVYPTGGMVEIGDSMDLNVTVNTTGLAEGLYHALIVVASNDLDEPLVYIPVNLSIVFEDDVGVISVNYPTGVNPPELYMVNATIENFGSMNQTDVLVNCSIYEGSPEYLEDFEADDGGYTHGGPTDLWAWGTPTSGPGSAHSGSYCWGTVLDGDYVNNANAMLTSVPITLSAGVSSELSFWHWYDTENYYDGGNVKISTNGGTTWEILGEFLDPYNEDAASPNNAGIPGEPCFSGHEQGRWEEVTFDLSSYEGEEIMLRWHFGSDGSVSSYPGWYIDDVRVGASESLDVGDLVYTAETTVDFIESYTTEYVEFTPPWDALPGVYAIKVKTMLPGDQDPGNDQAAQAVTIIGANDTGVVSINYPTGLQRPGDYTINTTVRNFGSVDQNVPVNCAIYNESDVVVYSSDTIVFIPYLSNKYVEFSPPWHVTGEGEYRIHATTLLPGDLQNNNNATEINVTIQHYTDAGAISVNYPGNVIPPGVYTVNATIENFGGQDKMVPVNCSIYEGSLEYLEEFEDDDGGYTHAVGPGPGTIDEWEWGTPDYVDGPDSAHSGVNCWGTVLDGEFSNYGDMVLDSVPIDLSVFDSPELSFYHWFDFGACDFDGGNVKISTDGGSNWVIIHPDGGYPEDSMSSGNQGIAGEPGYCGYGTSWELAVFDLSAYADGTVIIRWHCGTTTVVEQPGWYIDDVKVSSASSPLAAGDLVYSSDETVYVPALSTAYVEFTPPWDAIPGVYAVKVTTSLAGDENPGNDKATQAVSVIAANDTGVVSINYPTGLQRPDDYMVNATVRNFGSVDQNVPVNCSIYNESDVLVYSVDTIVFIPYLSNKYVEFTPAWHAVTPGEYRINVTTRLVGDEDTRNDAQEATVTIQPFTDVGTTSINYPGDLIPPGAYTVNATIENFGDTEQMVPVNCSIYAGGIGGVLLEDDFEGTFPPAGWTVVVNGDTGGEWKRNDVWGRDNYAGGSGYCADADSDEFGSGTYMDTELWTPSFSLAGVTSAELSFIAAYNDISSSGDYADVDISTDGGGTWANLLHWDEDHDASGPGENVIINLSLYTGNPDVTVRWHYGDATYDWWWEIDNVTVTSSGVGDLIYSSETTVSVPAISTAYVEFTPPWNAIPGFYAIQVTTMLPGDEVPDNDQVTQAVSVIAAKDAGVVSINYPTGLQRPGDYNVNATIENAGSVDQTVPVNCSIYNESDVLVYSSDTTVFIPALTTQYVEFAPTWHAITPGEYRINVTTQLAGDEDPRNDAQEATVTIQPFTDVGTIAINYPSDVIPPGAYTVNATIENFGDEDQIVPVNCSISGEEEVEGEILLEEDFDDTWVGSPPAPENWMQYCTNPSAEIWTQNDVRYVSPPYSAYRGGFSGSTLSDDWLVTPEINAAGHSNINLSWWERHGWLDYYTNFCGLWISCGSPDPDDGDYVLIVERIPPEIGVGDWVFCSIILDSYLTDNTFYIAWEYDKTSGGMTSCWNIDDVNISTSGSLATDDIVYYSEETVSVPALSTAYVEFTPPWNALPGTYEIKVTTLLPGDENPDNDQATQAVSVIAAKDAGVVSINHPTGTQRPGDYNVNVTIENAGSVDQNIPVHCAIYNESDVVVYSSDTTVFIPYLSEKCVEFTPAWHAAIVGDYRINVTTLLEGDEDNTNNATETIVTIEPYTDAAVISINYPPEETSAGAKTVNATIENCGSPEQLILVNCSIYSSVGLPYTEDFEADDGGYTHGGPTDIWAWGTPTDPDGPDSAHSGSYCWGTNPDGDYVDSANAILDSVSINLPIGIPAELSFWHWYDTELRYDGGNVKISTNGGSTWEILGEYLDPYNEDEAASGNAGIPGEPCFSGHGQGYWEEVTFDLSSYTGEEIILRWHFGSDSSVSGYPGWYIDDVVIDAIGAVSFDDDNLIYTSETTVSVSAVSTEYVEFTPPWDALPGVYAIQVKTILQGDEDPNNDMQTKTVTVTVICGDCNGDWIVDIGDVVYLINYLYRGGPAPDPICVGDCNDDGTVDIGDVVYLINYLYRGGPVPEGCCE